MQRRVMPAILVLAVLLRGLPVSAGEVAQQDSRPIRILCLGDSITHSVEHHCGYRYALWKKLVDRGISFDFIGSMNTRYYQAPGRECPPYKGRRFDPDHEGHWAWRADQILANEPSELFPQTGSGHLAQWLQGYTPDIVLMHLGHNDAGAYEPPAQMARELKEIIALLQKDNPRVAVLLAKVIPAANPAWNRQLEILNSVMEKIAAETKTATSDVRIVDQAAGFDPLQDTLDGTHPNDSGSEKMARVWLEGMLKVLKEP